MRIIGGIFVFLALVALGILIYASCTEQSFVEAITTIWQAIAGKPSATTPDDVEVAKVMIGYQG